MLVLLQNLGFQLPRPGSLGSGQQMCTVWEREKPVPGAVETSRGEGGCKSGEDNRHTGGGGGPLLILSPGNSGVGTGRCRCR